jgi:hypothetical protein
MGHSPFTRACRNAALAILAVGFLAGCTTAAQRQYQAMATGNQAILAQIKSCVTDAYNAPESAPLRPHFPLDLRDLTLAQMSDQSSPTKQEVDAVLTMHPRIQTCRKTALDGLLNTAPSVVPMLARTFAEADDDTITFVQRKRSWGEHVRRGRDRALAMQAGLQVEGQRIVAGLEQSHQAELARRQAALNAMAQWAQTQQVISAMNRPVTTNCMNLGSGMVNCVSQ